MLQSLLLAINTEDIWAALGLLWKGMLAIAIVIAVIIVITVLMNKLDSSLNKKKDAKSKDDSDDLQK